MRRFFILLAVIVVTSLLLWLMSGSKPLIWGMPVACTGTDDAFDSVLPCWISIGGVGVITLGVGVGVVSIGFAGVGLLFAAGQLAVGAIAFGQLALSLTFYCGQLGVGLTGVGQGGLGWMTAGQGSARGRPFLEALSRDINDSLALPLPWRSS